MTILDPITQAALALQNGSDNKLNAGSGQTIPVSFGHRVVQGFPIWVSQNTAPSTTSITGTLTGDSTNVSNGDTVNINGRVYTFQSVLTNVDGHVLIGSDARSSLTNLCNAINATGGVSGTDYAAVTTENADVVATNPTADTIVVAARGTSTGAAITTTETSAHLAWGGATLSTSDTIANELIHRSSAASILSGTKTADFAVAFGYSILPDSERTDTTIRRMWADGELIYDVTNPGAAPDFNGMKLTFHPGRQNAAPDSTILADMGKLTPGFRNLMYVVIRDFNLQVGPTPVAPPPVTTAPVTVKTTQTYPHPPLGVVGDLGSFDAGLDDVGVGGWGHLWLQKPANPAYPEGGLQNGVYISFINDSQATKGIGGGYNSLNGSVQPYPVAIGPGLNVISGDEDGPVTVERTTITPGTVTQAPAPSPTYRTSLPVITVELADSLATIPDAQQYDLINDSQSAMALGSFVDYDRSLIYGWTRVGSATPPGFLMHTYSLADMIELQRFGLVQDYTIQTGSPDAHYYDGPILEFDFLAAHDRINGLCFTMLDLGNSEPIGMIDLASGQIVSAWGRQSTEVFDVPEVSIGMRASGDCVVATSSAGRIYGVVTGAFLHTGQVGLTVYTPRGVMTDGGSVQLAEAIGNDTVQSVLAYPIVGRPDLMSKYGLSATAIQDWYVFAFAGSNVYLVHGSDKVIDYELVYTTQESILATFYDPADHGVVMITTSAGGITQHIEKFLVDTRLTAGGVTPSFGGSLYRQEITPQSVTNLELCLRESRFNNGQMLYPTGSTIVTIDLGDGTTSNVVDAPTDVNGGNIESFVYDSVTGIMTSVGRGTGGTGVGGGAAAVRVTGGVGGRVPLASLLRWLPLAAGYTADEVSVAAEINETVEGGLIDSKVGLWAYLRNLATVFDFVYFESEGKIKFTRGTSGDTAAAAFTINLDDIAKSSNGSADLNENVITTLAAPVEVAGGVEVDYLDSEFGFQPNAKTFNRSRFPFKNFKLGNVAAYSTYIVMTGSEALQRAARIAFSNYAHGVVQAFRLPFAYARLEPGDAINLIINDFTYLVNPTEVVFNADWSLSVTGVDFNYRNDVAIAADKPLGLTPSATGPSDSLPLFIDSTLPTAADDPGQADALLFTGVESFGQSWWTGAALNIMEGAAADWTRLYYSTKQTPYGQCTTLLPPTATPFQTDNGSVDLVGTAMTGSGTSTSTDANFFAGTNAAYVGNTGRWELIYYKSITWHNSRRFTITGMLRGRRGTETHCNDHQVGDYFIPLNRNVLQPYKISQTKVGEQVSMSAVGQGTFKPATIVTSTLDGNSLKPWAPYNIKATRT